MDDQNDLGRKKRSPIMDKHGVKIKEYAQWGIKKGSPKVDMLQITGFNKNDINQDSFSTTNIPENYYTHTRAPSTGGHVFGGGVRGAGITYKGESYMNSRCKSPILGGGPSLPPMRLVKGPFLLMYSTQKHQHERQLSTASNSSVQNRRTINRRKELSKTIGPIPRDMGRNLPQGEIRGKLSNMSPGEQNMENIKHMENMENTGEYTNTNIYSESGGYAEYAPDTESNFGKRKDDIVNLTHEYISTINSHNTEYIRGGPILVSNTKRGREENNLGFRTSNSTGGGTRNMSRIRKHSPCPPVGSLLSSQHMHLQGPWVNKGVDGNISPGSAYLQQSGRNYESYSYKELVSMIQRYQDQSKGQLLAISSFRKDKIHLGQEVAKMKQINKKLISGMSTQQLKTLEQREDWESKELTNKDLGGIHQLYQDLFLGDLREEVEGMKEADMVHKREIHNLENIIEKEKDKNIKLRKRISSYETMLENTERKEGEISRRMHKDYRISRNMPRDIITPLPISRTLSRNSLEPGTPLHRSSSSRHGGPRSAAPPFDFSKGDKLVTLIKEFAVCRTLPHTFAKVFPLLKSLLGAQNASFFVISHKLHSDAGINYIGAKCVLSKIYYLKQWMDVVSENQSSMCEPVFTTLVDIKQGSRSRFRLIGGAVNPYTKEVYLGIQIEKSREDKFKKINSGFSSHDELFFKLFCATMSIKISELLLLRTRNLNIKKVKDLQSMSVQFLKEKTYHGIVEKMRDLMAPFAGFQDMALLFYEQKSNELFAIHGGSLMQGDKGIMKIPLGIGITGKVFKSMEPIYANDGKLPIGYSNDVDNLNDLAQVTSMLFLGLKNSEGRKIGIAHFYNKLDGNITQKDIDEIKPLENFLTAFVENVTELNTSMNLIISLQKNLHSNQSNKTDLEENNTSMFGALGEQMHSLEGMLDGIIKKRERRTLGISGVKKHIGQTVANAALELPTFTSIIGGVSGGKSSHTSSYISESRKPTS